MGLVAWSATTEGKLNPVQGLRTPLVRWWEAEWYFEVSVHQHGNYRYGGCAQLTASFVAGWRFGGGSEEPCYPDWKVTLRRLCAKPSLPAGAGVMDEVISWRLQVEQSRTLPNEMESCTTV